MKKITQSLIVSSSMLSASAIYAGDLGTVNTSTTNWTGLYAGANIGSAWSSSEWH